MDSMTWLTQELSREKIHKINLNKKIALVILHWIWVNRFYHLSSDPEFENAMQWVTNKISKKYAHGHLIWK